MNCPKIDSKLIYFVTKNQGKSLPKNSIFRPLKRGQISLKLPKILFFTIPMKYLGLLKNAKSLRYKGSFFILI